MRILPRRGILTLDYINLVHHDRSRRMRRHAFSFDFRRRRAVKTKTEERFQDKDEEEDSLEDPALISSTGCPPSVSTSRHQRGPSHRAKASAIIRRTIAAPGSFEFCLNFEVNGEYVPQKAIPRMSLPVDGKLRFEVASYVEHSAIKHRSFLSVCENLASQSTAQQRQLLCLGCTQHGRRRCLVHPSSSVLARARASAQWPRRWSTGTRD